MTQGAALEWTVEPFLSSNTLRFRPDTTPADQMQDCNEFVSIDCAVFDLQATVSITNSNAGMTLADLTSTDSLPELSSMGQWYDAELQMEMQW